MSALVRAEFLKHRSTQTTVGLLASLIGLVLLAVLLHGFGLPAERLGGADEQLFIAGRGEFLAALFGGLLGALSVTTEIRHGTIRPTFLVSPWRQRVVAAKVWVSIVLGAVFGLVGSAVGVAATTAALRSRGIDVTMDSGDYVLLIAGSTVAAALWAAVGVGVGAVVRNQIPTLVGLCAWTLFVEGLLAGDQADSLADVGRFLPGQAAAAISGQNPDQLLLAPTTGIAVLLAYTIGAALIGTYATVHRDVT